jgi:hypothetical protein
VKGHRASGGQSGVRLVRMGCWWGVRVLGLRDLQFY